LHVEIVDGDLLDQDVDVVINAWNRNIIPWWLSLMLDALSTLHYEGRVVVVRYAKREAA
jgi:hypothetical protein